MTRALADLLSTWRGRFIAAFVAIQLALPATYYLVRRDPRDERWAWRMFSPTRMEKCDPAFTVGGAPQPLAGVFHEAWIELARRGRREVIEAMAQHLCQRHPGKSVRVTLTCTSLDGTKDSIGGFDLCEVPEL